MKQELVDKFMAKALKYLESAEAFTTKEVPQYVQELMQFKFVEHMIEGVTDILIVTMIFGIALSALLGVGVAAFIDDHYSEDLKIQIKCGVAVFFVAITVFIIATTVGNSSDFIQAYKAKNAPRVYLIDYIRGQK